MSNPACQIISFEFKETTLHDPGLTIDSNCPAIPDTSDACRTIIIPTDNIRLVDESPPEFKYEFLIVGTHGLSRVVTGWI